MRAEQEHEAAGMWISKRLIDDVDHNGGETVILLHKVASAGGIRIRFDARDEMWRATVTVVPDNRKEQRLRRTIGSASLLDLLREAQRIGGYRGELGDGREYVALPLLCAIAGEHSVDIGIQGGGYWSVGISELGIYCNDWPLMRALCVLTSMALAEGKR